MPWYLDATDEHGNACQVEISDEAADRERRRNLFSMTAAPRGTCAIRKRNNYGWAPTRLPDYDPEMT